MFQFSKNVWNFKFSKKFRISKKNLNKSLEFQNMFNFFMFFQFSSLFKIIIWNSKLFSMSKHMQAAKQSLSSACLSAYIAAKQQQLHGLSMSTLIMYERRPPSLGP